MRQISSLQEWLNRHWVAASLCMEILLIVLTPVLAQPWPSASLLVFAMLSSYMFHHVEEHTDNRFRVFVNQHIFHGVEALTRPAVLWINLPGVWGVGLLSIYAATFLNIGWGRGATLRDLV